MSVSTSTLARAPLARGAAALSRAGGGMWAPASRIRLTGAVLCGALLLAAPAVALCWQAYTSERDSQLRQTQGVARAVASNAATFLDQRLQMVSAIAQSPTIRDTNAPAMQQYFDRIQGQLHFTGGIAWADRDGEVRALSGASPGALPIDVNRTEFGREALGATAPTILKAMSTGSARPYVVIVVPTTDSTGKPNGVLGGGFLLDDLEGLAKDLTTTSKVVIVDGGGQLIVDGGPVSTLRDVSGSPLLPKLDRANGAILGVTGVDGEGGRIAGGARVPAGGWRVIVERSENDVLGRARAMLVAEASAICLVALAVTTLAWIVGGRRERRAREAQETRQRIEELNEQLERRLAEVETALGVKDEFLGSVSHELRTPLTSLVGLVHMLHRRAGELDDGSRSEALDQAVADADRLQGIIEDMLVLARLDRSPTDPEPILLQRLLPAILEAHRRTYPGRAIETSVEPDLPMVSAHAMWVDQVLSNLLANAAKYTSGSEPISVVARRAGDAVSISVEDRGPGLSSEEAAEVFEPFRRLERDRYRAPGSGLGLAVCKRLVELMDGKIWAAPHAGGGSTFTFTLPVLRDSDGMETPRPADAVAAVS